MGVPCGLTGTVELIEGDGVDIVADIPNGTYTISLDTATLALIGTYKIYANEAARDSDNPSPASGDAAYGQSEDTLWVHDGIGWVIIVEPWQDYTPTLTNMTLGDGARAGRYKRSNGTCEFTATFTLGSTSAMGTAPAMGLPVAAAASPFNSFNTGLVETGVGGYPGSNSAVAGGGTSVTLLAINTSSTYAVNATVTASVPFIWGNTDIISVVGTFEMDSRYD